ncbi:MAG: VWA domain-containing protein [Lachnospiraceae bacterium]|nr:VWA domain-containing protein [Lachnospiraceae bacterium]
MRNLNPVIPATALIAAFSAMLLILVIAWIWSRESRIKSTFTLALRVAIVCLVLFIALRPMREEHGTDVKLSNLDVLFVLDTTLSMWAYDGSFGTRMEDARNDIGEIMDALPGANFGLITFQNKSTVLAPFTQDKDAVMRYLNSINIPDKSYAQGSRMDVPYYDIENMLISSDRKEDRHTVIFFLSDGEDTDPDPSSYSYEELGFMVDGGAVIGYGTTEGGEMLDMYGFRVYYDGTLEPGISRIDEGNLKNVASGLGLEYLHCSDKEGLKPILEEILEDSGTVTEKNNDLIFLGDTYFKYVPYLTGLLVLELLIGIRQNVRTRRIHGKKRKQKTE